MVSSSLEYELKAVNKKSMIWFQRGSSIIQLILRRRNVLSLGNARGAQRRGCAKKGCAKSECAKRGCAKGGCRLQGIGNSF